MLGMLFRGLTTHRPRGSALFDAVTALARRPHWYVEGEVPDTIDGRFAMLATIAALTIVRLEQLGEAGVAQSAALTERFIEAIEAEHRELGLGDPTLGKTVRKLVGSLARRVDLWRSDGDWRERVGESIYKAQPRAGPLNHASSALSAFWAKLERSDVQALADGRIE